MVKNSPGYAGDAGSIPGSGRSPGEGNGNPLQYSCLENPTDRGAWQATVHGIARVGQDLTLSFVDSKRYWNKIYVCLIAYIAIGEGNGNPLQCSRLENPRDGGAWWAAVYGVAQSRTLLND